MIAYGRIALFLGAVLVSAMSAEVVHAAGIATVVLNFDELRKGSYYFSSYDYPISEGIEKVFEAKGPSDCEERSCEITYLIFSKEGEAPIVEKNFESYLGSGQVFILYSMYSGAKFKIWSDQGLKYYLPSLRRVERDLRNNPTDHNSRLVEDAVLLLPENYQSLRAATQVRELNAVVSDAGTVEESTPRQSSLSSFAELIVSGLDSGLYVIASNLKGSTDNAVTLHAFGAARGPMLSLPLNSEDSKRFRSLLREADLNDRTGRQVGLRIFHPEDFVENQLVIQSGSWSSENGVFSGCQPKDILSTETRSSYETRQRLETSCGARQVQLKNASGSHCLLEGWDCVNMTVREISGSSPLEIHVLREVSVPRLEREGLHTFRINTRGLDFPKRSQRVLAELESNSSDRALFFDDPQLFYHSLEGNKGFRKEFGLSSRSASEFMAASVAIHDCLKEVQRLVAEPLRSTLSEGLLEIRVSQEVSAERLRRGYRDTSLLYFVRQYFLEQLQQQSGLSSLDVQVTIEPIPAKEGAEDEIEIRFTRPFEAPALDARSGSLEQREQVSR